MSGGRITLAIYIAIGFIPVAFGPAAVGQSSTHVKTWPETLRQVEQSATVPPGWKPVEIKPLPLERAPDVVVINYGQGGRLNDHKLRFAHYRRAQTKVEVRGPCYSACTVLLAYIEPENLCIGEKAFMAFHAVRSIEYGQYMENETFKYFLDLPRPIQRWINAKGSWQALPLDGYWYMRNHELWAMGYPKCPASGPG